MVLELNALSQLKDKARQIDQASSVVKQYNTGWMKIAASIMLLAVIGISFYGQTYSSDNLYDTAYEPAQDYITNMDSDLSPIEQALSHYNKGEINIAMQELQTLTEAEPSNQEALFYLGQCQLRLGEFNLAINSFQQVNNNYHAEAQWYVALALIKTKKEDEAIKTLGGIISAQEDEAFVLKAKELKGKLESPFRKLTF
jgi:tetratricopeptide (TPR) repeat protein